MSEKKIDGLLVRWMDLPTGGICIMSPVSSHLISSYLAIHPLLYPCLSAPCACVCAFDNQLNSHSQCKRKPRALVCPCLRLPRLPHPSIFHLSGLDRPTSTTAAVSPSRARSVCGSSRSERPVYLSAWLTWPPACLPACLPFVPTNTPPPKPHVRPSVRPFVAPRGSTRE